MVKIAALQYRYDFPDNFLAYQKKLTTLVEDLSEKKIDLLLFPEYAGLEMLSFSPLNELQNYMDSYLNLFSSLSEKHHLYICSGSQIVSSNGKFYNRSFLFSPKGTYGYQDKCFLVPEEKKEGILSAGNKITLFNTSLGKFAICICYDIEFPTLVEKFTHEGAQILLVPSYTATVWGFNRVFLSCRARALENQCYVVQAPLIGQTDVEIAYGAASFCSPVDRDFPEDGLLAQGPKDTAHLLIEELNLEILNRVRKEGQTQNFLDQKKIHLEQQKFEVEEKEL